MLMNPERASKLTWSGSAFRMMMMMIIRRSRVAQNFMKIWFDHDVFLACLIDLNFFSQNFMKNWFNGGVSCLIASKLFSQNFIKDWFDDGHVILAWLIINFLAELHEQSDSMMNCLLFFSFGGVTCHVMLTWWVVVVVAVVIVVLLNTWCCEWLLDRKNFHMSQL